MASGLGIPLAIAKWVKSLTRLSLAGGFSVLGEGGVSGSVMSFAPMVKPAIIGVGLSVRTLSRHIFHWNRVSVSGVVGLGGAG